MKTAVTLEADKRDNAGKGAARALRRAGKVPAILYAKDEEPVKFALTTNDLTLQYRKGAFLSKLVTLKFGKETIHALPREVQLHPVTDVIEHADFQKVNADSNIHVWVPVKVSNQEKSIGLKRGGVLNIVRHEIELICKPDAIPAAITIDILNTNIGDSIHINSIELPKGVTPAIKDRNFTVVTVSGRSKSDDDAPAAAAAATAAAGAAAAAPAADKKADKK